MGGARGTAGILNFGNEMAKTKSKTNRKPRRVPCDRGWGGQERESKTENIFYNKMENITETQKPNMKTKSKNRECTKNEVLHGRQGKGDEGRPLKNDSHRRWESPPAAPRQTHRTPRLRRLMVPGPTDQHLTTIPAAGGNHPPPGPLGQLTAGAPSAAGAECGQFAWRPRAAIPAAADIVFPCRARARRAPRERSASSLPRAP